MEHGFTARADRSGEPVSVRRRTSSSKSRMRTRIHRPGVHGVRAGRASVVHRGEPLVARASAARSVESEHVSRPVGPAQDGDRNLPLWGDGNQSGTDGKTYEGKQPTRVLVGLSEPVGVSSSNQTALPNGHVGD